MMENSSCAAVSVKRDKSWSYDEYYIGERDEEDTKDGQGINHWTGAKSIEWYTGQFLRGTMHGVGVYRWRHLRGNHYTYEGYFHCNRIHGYGTMSYPDGRVFTGLFHSNIRLGPGVERHACLRENVGLWRGAQLLRLAWRPASGVLPDLYNVLGKACVDPHRVVLTKGEKKIGETNSALDLLKYYGADPTLANKKWKKLYPNHCTDLASPLCFVELFQHDYYKGKIKLLKEFSSIQEEPSQVKLESNPDSSTYYAWNNNSTTIHMMKHSYTHDEQRNKREINIAEILSGPRTQFKTPGKHEIDCRSLMMSSYLGHSSTVVKLVKDNNVHSDVADSLGNSALMYATCGDQVDIMHFLIDAGANINYYNDSCCTPLGLALLRFACEKKDISPKDLTQAILPSPVDEVLAPGEMKTAEWNFARDQNVSRVATGLTGAPSKLSKAPHDVKKTKSSHSLKDLTIFNDKSDLVSTLPLVPETASDESPNEDIKMYNDIINDFEAKINDVFSRPSAASPVPFLFEVHDIIKDTEFSDEDPKTTQGKNNKQTPSKSKVLKETMKPSKEIMWQSADKDDFSPLSDIQKHKNEMMDRMMLTILQLLLDGADPNLVKCPYPALFIAIVSGSSDLVKHLVNHGADINEAYNKAFGYTPLDFAVSREFSFENLDLIRTILDCGAKTSHTLRSGNSSSQSLSGERGPTLLHAVLARKINSDTDDEIKDKILEILLEYKCNPLIQFKGRSAVDVAMSKSMDIFDIFIRCSTTDLNAVINDLNQTALVKMLYLPFFRTVPHLERLRTLTNLLLFGADPLITCTSGTEEYPNIFSFALKTLTELEAGQTKVNSFPAAKGSAAAASKKKPAPASVKKETPPSKSLGKLDADDVRDYKQTVEMVKDCARLMHVRWLQAKLVKELVHVIDRYKHRHWNMIIKEYDGRKKAGLWLTARRCLEAWDVLELTTPKVYNDGRVLKHLLHIVEYYNRFSNTTPSSQLTAEEKTSIEISINSLLKERVVATKPTTAMGSWKRVYMKPELTSKVDEDKFKICFECALPLPLNEEKFQCVSCKMVAFCSLTCMDLNIKRANEHPCSEYLKMKFFPNHSESAIENSL